MLPQSFSARAMESGAKYGVIAGLIATWSISTAIAASEIELGLPIGAFYAMIGAGLGYENPAATYVGFGLHLLTGAVLGVIICLAAVRFMLSSLLNPYRSVLMGMAAGVAVWLVLFLPVTLFLVEPMLDGGSGNAAGSPAQAAASAAAGQSMWGIALSAIAFHIVWGAIFGYVASSLMRIRAFRLGSSGSGQKMHKEGGMTH